ncbi:MAG TPA: geranylgeranyl reductase family protein [Acidimicrobiales bacterium]|nr:geranylgeranyl reductase family protein [Acidimicrobiales bacterium]
MADGPGATPAVVVGGGPAGAAAAITLARAGAEVLLVDKARFPRDKCCGDGLTADALRQLEELGLRPESVPDWTPVSDVFVRSPVGRTVHFELPAGQGQFAAVAPRAQLDAALLDVARAAGAKVADGHGLGAARGVAGGVELDVDGLGTLLASHVIGADGAWSPLRHALGANEPGYLGDWHAFRQYFSGVGPAAEGLWIWFEPDLLPGYAWSFPLQGGRANVGFGILRDAGIPVREMKDLWPELLARPAVREVLGGDARPEGVHKAWPIPARVDKLPLTAADGRALFVGDAACATDPMTGEGIAQALLTGRLAAAAVLAAHRAGGGPGEAAGPAYEKAVERELFADHRLSRLLSRALSHRKGVRIALRVAGSSDWTRRNFGRWLFEDYPRAVALTPSRWHRGVLSGTGAYRP